MNPALDAGAGDSTEHALAQAYRALEEGQPQPARELAQSVLIAAKARGDLQTEARAFACLAHCDRVASRLRRASDTSRRAAQLFEQLGDVEGEAAALTTLAHVCMLLGRNDEAVESALLCVRLCDLSTPKLEAMLAHNCLGIAYCWGGNFAQANAALDTAIEMASRCDPPVSPYQPRLNHVWVEASRLIDERYRTGKMPSVAKMARLVRVCERLETEGDDAMAVAGLQPLSRTISLVMAGLLAAWQGDFDTARARNESATRSLVGIVTWLDALVRWGMGELAWAQKDWPAAEKAFAEMKQMALAAEHEQLASTAQLLLAQVYELQGKTEAARLEHRALRVRERRMVAESLLSREVVVAWRLGARQSERHLQQALLASKQFERWSLEDALTGIANRRCFERTFAERLRYAGVGTRPLTVAMIDVNKFKSINDTYTHQVGDRVLKTLAAIMASQVREHDLPARWAGDEFVILFDDADEAMATQICMRVQAAIADFDWHSIAPGLRVSVSIGLSQTQDDDNVDSVLHRSDESMYQTKPVDLSTH